MTLPQLTNYFFGSLTVLAQILVVCQVLAFATRKSATSQKIIAFFGKNYAEFAFFVAFAATAGSLFFSDVLRYEPCRLCWYQRIFMYPQVILFAIAMYRKSREIALNSLVLSIIGGLLAVYHYALQLGLVPEIKCGIVGYSTSCSERFVMTYGYITIPLMAASAFALLIVMTVSHHLNSKLLPKSP